MRSFEQKAYDHFGELIINKSFSRKAGFGRRAIPVYVREWIVSHFVEEETDITDESRRKIASFVRKYAPDKSEREMIKNLLYEQNDVKLLDDYSVQVDLKKGDRYLVIPYLDENKASVPQNILNDNDMLLSSGVWGVGELSYAPPGESGSGQVIMRSFTPFQLARLDLDYIFSARSQFSTKEWIDLIVNSMGFNHEVYDEREKILLLSRLIPLVEPRYNLIELAPKGTGKSFVFENMSRYVTVRSGALTAPVLFYNKSRNSPGLITKYDCVVIDEAQKVRGDRSGELTALLKSYLEAGHFSRGDSGLITSECGIVILANIELDENKNPLHELIGLFRNFPNFLRETAFLDRFSGLLPGWDLPRITNRTPSTSLGLKGDIFGEILHELRKDIQYRDYVKTNMELENCDDMRDHRAIESGTTGLLKIIFPDLNPSEEDFYQYCVNPALEMRQRVRDELCKMDREYEPVSMRSKYPDRFQKSHQKVGYVDPDQVDEEALSEVSGEEEEEDKEAESLLLTDETELDKANRAIEKTLEINKGETGYSYQILFGPYLDDVNSVTLIDPYIRYEYQIKNLMAFIQLLSSYDNIESLHLINSADDAYQAQDIERKLKELAKQVKDHGVDFAFEFDKDIHDREIVLDNGWRIYPGRGLDIFEKPESRYGLSVLDQKKRECKETKIIYRRD